MARLQLKTALKDKFRCQATFFYDTFFEALSVSQRELDRRFQQKGHDPQFSGFLEDEAADLNAFIGEASQLLLVALYHWVERELKGIVAHCDSSATRDTRTFQVISATLALHHVCVDHIPSFDQVNVLRLFANSWKHDPWWASQPLLKALGLNPKAQLRLSDFSVETGLRRCVSLDDVTEERDLILAFRDRALVFLCAVADAAPIEFVRKPSSELTRPPNLLTRPNVSAGCPISAMV